MKNLFYTTFCFLLFSSTLIAQNTIKVEIVNFDSNKGLALVGLYNSENNFMETEFKGKEIAITNKKVVFEFTDVPDGTYAITVFHDEDENGELTTNFIGIPKESYGASNDAPARFGPPKWKDAKFEVKDGKTVVKKINL